MRFVIVGAGALGTILGAHLVTAGHAVACVVRGRRIAQLQKDGLKLTGLRDMQAQCEVVSDPSTLTETDVLVIGTKTYQTTEAVELVKHLRPRLVFSMANGVKKTEQLCEAFDNATVLGCMANVSGELLENGVVDFTRNVCLHIGALDLISQEQTAELAQLIDDAGIVCRAEENIKTVEWSKYVGWVAFMALAVITRAKTADFLTNDNHASLASRLIKEMALIAAAKNIELVDQSPMPVRTIADGSTRESVEAVLNVGHEFATNAPGHRMSSLQDLQRGATLEFSDTLGYAVELSAALGVAAPTINDCFDLVAGIDAINHQ